MEPMFYNRRVMTPEHARELYRHVVTQYHIIYGILFLAYLAINIYFIYYGEINILALILLVAVIAVYIYQPYSYSKKRIKNYQALHNAVEEDVAEFFDDYFVSRDINTKQEIKIEYSRLTKVRSTKNLYIFHIKNSKTRIVTDKNMIAHGDENNFEKFINSKISNIK